MSLDSRHVSLDSRLGTLDSPLSTITQTHLELPGDLAVLLIHCSNFLLSLTVRPPTAVRRNP